MFWQERKTRREFLRWLGGLAVAFAFGIPLVGEFIEDARALGELSQPPTSRGVPKDPLKPELIETQQAAETRSQEITSRQEVSERLETNQLAVYERLEDLPGFMDRRGEVAALVGYPKERERPITFIIWHWTWTDPEGEDGVGITKLLGNHCYHFCILPQNVDNVFARFQYLTDINAVAYHTRGVNEISIGISYIGKGPPTPQQERTRRLLTLWLMENFGLPPENIKVHSEEGNTADIAGVRRMNVNDPNWKEGIDWERRKLASILRGLHPKKWARRDENGKWIIPELKDDALSVQEAAVVAWMTAENWGIPPDEVFLPLISSESNFCHWRVDGKVVKDYSGGEGIGIGQIVPRCHPEVDAERAESDASYNLNQAARILLKMKGSGDWEEGVLRYKGNRKDFLDFFREVRDSFPPVDIETGLREWRWQLPKPWVFDRGPSDRKVIALTFDGGWADPRGREVLRVLRQLKVQSTIFLTGQYIQAGSGLVEEMLRDGHEIGNHSFGHPDFSHLDESQIKRELKATAETFQGLTGRPMSIWFRFPYGSCDQKAVQAVCNNGYQAVGWSVASRDWEGISSEEIFNDISGKAHPGAIIALHLGGKNTATALEAIIPELRNKNYRFVTLSEMFERVGLF